MFDVERTREVNQVGPSVLTVMSLVPCRSLLPPKVATAFADNPYRQLTPTLLLVLIAIYLLVLSSFLSILPSLSNIPQASSDISL